MSTGQPRCKQQCRRNRTKQTKPRQRRSQSANANKHCTSRSTHHSSAADNGGETTATNPVVGMRRVPETDDSPDHREVGDRNVHHDGKAQINTDSRGQTVSAATTTTNTDRHQVTRTQRQQTTGAEAGVGEPDTEQRPAEDSGAVELVGGATTPSSERGIGGQDQRNSAAEPGQQPSLAGSSFKGWEFRPNPSSGIIRSSDSNSTTERRHRIPTSDGGTTRKIERSTSNTAEDDKGGTCSGSVPRTTRTSGDRNKPATETTVPRRAFGTAQFGRSTKETKDRRINCNTGPSGAKPETPHIGGRPQTVWQTCRTGTQPPSMVPTARRHATSSSTTARPTERTRRRDSQTLNGGTRSKDHANRGQDRHSKTTTAMQSIPANQSGRHVGQGPVLRKPVGSQRTSKGVCSETAVCTRKDKDGKMHNGKRPHSASRLHERVPSSSTSSRIGKQTTVSSTARIAERGSVTTGTEHNSTSGSEMVLVGRASLHRPRTTGSDLWGHAQSSTVRGSTATSSKLCNGPVRTTMCQPSRRHSTTGQLRNNQCVHRNDRIRNDTALLRLDTPPSVRQSEGSVAEKSSNVRRSTLATRGSDTMVTTGTRQTTSSATTSIPQKDRRRATSNIPGSVSSTGAKSESHVHEPVRTVSAGTQLGRVQRSTQRVEQDEQDTRSGTVGSTYVTSLLQRSTPRSANADCTSARRPSDHDQRTTTSNHNRRHLRSFIWSTCEAYQRQSSRVPPNTANRSSVHTPHTPGVGRNVDGTRDNDRQSRLESNVSLRGSSRTTQRQHGRSEERQRTRQQNVDGTAPTGSTSRTPTSRTRDINEIHIEGHHGFSENGRGWPNTEDGRRRTSTVHRIGCGVRFERDAQSSGNVETTVRRPTDRVDRRMDNTNGKTNVVQTLHQQTSPLRSDSAGCTGPRLAGQEVYEQTPLLFLSGQDDRQRSAELDRTEHISGGSSTVLAQTTELVAKVSSSDNQVRDNSDAQPRLRLPSRRSIYGNTYNPEISTDCSVALREFSRAAGLGGEIVDTYSESFASGNLRSAYLPWADVVRINRKLATASGTNWAIATLIALKHLYDAGLYNRVGTTARSAIMMLKLALNVDMSDDERIAKIRKAARDRQQEAIAEKGGRARTTILLRKTHVQLMTKLATTPFNRWTFVEQRTAVSLYWMIITAARPAEIGPAQLYVQTIKRYYDENKRLITIKFNLWKSKDVKIAAANQHERPATQQQHGYWSSQVEIQMPVALPDLPLPPIAEWIDGHISSALARREVPYVQRNWNGKDIRCTPLFLGAPNLSRKTKYPPIVKSGTLTTQIRELLIKCGSIEGKAAPHHCYEIRKTVLTSVLHARPQALQTAHELARHSREVFFRAYELEVTPLLTVVLTTLAQKAKAQDYPLSTIMCG